MNKYIKSIIFLIPILLISCNKNEVILNDVVTVTMPLGEIIINENEITNEVEDETLTKTEEVEDLNTNVILIELSVENIMWLQESLKIAGFYTSMDGSFGSNTKTKLIAFQKTLNNFERFGEYDERTKKELQKIRDEKIAPNLGEDLVFINKDHFLPSSFIPKNLREVNVKKNKSIELASHVATKVEEMFEDAKDDGIILYLASGYRSYSYQEGIFSRRVKSHGFESAETVVAIPGQSEHQTGLTIDVTSEGMSFSLSQSFDKEKEFDWINENCSKYGFILRYTKDKSDITKYIYEPWHYRYIGDIEIAKYIMENNLVLEEYFENLEN